MLKTSKWIPWIYQPIKHAQVSFLEYGKLSWAEMINWDLSVGRVAISPNVCRKSQKFDRYLVFYFFLKWTFGQNYNFFTTKINVYKFFTKYVKIGDLLFFWRFKIVFAKCVFRKWNFFLAKKRLNLNLLAKAVLIIL